MPTPPRTSIAAIVDAGLEILESRGLPALTMQAVAQATGVRAPSLYKHVADRDALVSFVADAAAVSLATRLAAEDTLDGLARGLRTWATAHPHAFLLVFSGQGSPEVAAAAGASVLSISRGLVGSADALAAARLVTAWATGFISMELAGAFQLGGDVEVAFDYALAHLTSALSAG